MTIPFLELQMRVAQIFPDAKAQDIAPAPYVHVFDSNWLQEDFWPVWCEVKRELDAKLPVRPMTNNSKRRICEEINKRLIAELTLSCRVAHGDEDIAPGALEATVQIGGRPLNLVSDGWHRTAILAVSRDGKDWQPEFVESQLSYAQFQTTPLLDAADLGVHLRERWV